MDTRAKDDLIRAHLDLVSVVARQVARDLGRGSRTLDDLESAAREGLVLAAQRFDPERGVPFRNFASYRIRGAVIDAMRREGSLPRRAYQRLRQLEAAADLNEARAEERAAPEAPGTTASMRDAKVAEHLANLATAFATGLLLPTVSQGEEIVSVDGAPLVDEALESQEMLEQVRVAVDGLPEQERTLVRRHYFEGHRFDHVATELGMSKSWASRLHTRAIGRLTQALRGR